MGAVMRFLVRLVVVAVLAFAVGFPLFAWRVTHQTPPSNLSNVDAIVALTGGGGTRLEAAMALLEQGVGQRLLISGVHPDTPPEDVRQLANGSAQRFDCCVDLGFSARTTAGNAQEVADWVAARGYDNVLVVTSDYHVPRALAMVRAGSPDVRFTGWPVPPADDAKWWANAKVAKRFGVEYVKWLVVSARGLVGAVA